MKNGVTILIGLLIPFLCQAALNHPKEFQTQKIENTHVIINGHLDESFWQSIPWASEFTQWDPNNGAEATEKTAFKIAFDDANIYVAIRAYDSNPDSIIKRMSKRDEIDGDQVTVHFDSYYDKRTAFAFMVSASGVKTDWVITENGNSEDFDWNPVWHCKSKIDGQGWIAEIQIPLTQLRFSEQEEQTWGLQVGRLIYRKEEFSVWNPVPRDTPGWVISYGTLTGIHSLTPKNEFSITPYTVAKTERYFEEKEDPFSKGHEEKITGGIDGKIGVTNNLTLDFTINPDFGQVEADPSEVNLTAYETYFAEKRPFFIEGRNIMTYTLMPGGGEMSAEQMFYSRRIGRRPQHDPDLNDDEYIKSPNNTNILGAFKLTGKTKKGWSVGVLESFTSKEVAEIAVASNKRDITVEPFTNYFLARLQKDNNDGNTIIGGILTATNRNIDDNQLNFLHKEAYTGGVDYTHFWKDKTYMIQAKALFSHVAGKPEAIINTQESAGKYFQRPDASHLGVDSNLTSLTGTGGTIHIGKVSSGHFEYGLLASWRSPNLELNDMGYLRDADVLMEILYGEYEYWDQIGIFRNISLNLAQWSGWNFGGDHLFSGMNINGNVQFTNFWGVGLMTNLNFNTLSSSLLRGGPSFIEPGNLEIMANIHTAQTKKLNFSIGTFQKIGFSGYLNMNNYFGEIVYKPVNSLSLALNPMYQLNKYDIQYIDVFNYNGTDQYLMGRIDQNTFSLSFRLNLNLTPNLSIQYYGQPFISSGKYDQFKKVTDSRASIYSDRFHIFPVNDLEYISDDEIYGVDDNSDGTSDYYFDNPDFNFLDFKSNLVARWEYKPGSTLYIVWSQMRNDSYSTGIFDFDHDMTNLFDTYPYNIFLIKLSYRFGR